MFSHWQDDAVGVSNQVTVAMDLARNVEAVFIPETAAERLAEANAAQGGYCTRDQLHNLELGNLVLDADVATGQARVGVQLQETSDLTNPDCADGRRGGRRSRRRKIAVPQSRF